jgi:phage/plasmid-associated DNA primase
MDDNADRTGNVTVNKYLYGGPNEPFYTQICRKMSKRGDLFLMPTQNGKKHTYLRLKDGKYNEISEDELKMLCKDILKKYLNRKVYNSLVEGCDTVAEGGIAVDAEILKAAKKKGFTLIKEAKDLIEEIKTMKEFHKERDSLLPPKNIVPFKNGFFDFTDDAFHPYGEKGYQGFLFQMDANYNKDYAQEDLPKPLMGLIENGISRYGMAGYIDLSRDNLARKESFLDCLAYALVPGNPLRLMFFIIGPTATGKSTLVAIIRAVFGDLGVHLQSPSIMRKTRSDHELRADLLDAVEKRFIDISETDQKQEVDATMVKSWTGDDPITFRLQHKPERFTKEMAGKIYLVANEFPKLVNYGDAALKERLVVIDWNNTVSPERRKPGLKALLTTDEMRDRIASYFIARVRRLHPAYTLNIHPTFKFNIQKYFLIGGDIVAIFWDTALFKNTRSDINTVGCISTYDLYRCFLLYCQKQGITAEDIPNLTAFAMRFSEIVGHNDYYFVDKKPFANGRFYLGIAVRPEYCPGPLMAPENNLFPVVGAKFEKRKYRDQINDDTHDKP